MPDIDIDFVNVLSVLSVFTGGGGHLSVAACLNVRDEFGSARIEEGALTKSWARGFAKPKFLL